MVGPVTAVLQAGDELLHGRGERGGSFWQEGEVGGLGLGVLSGQWVFIHAVSLGQPTSIQSGAVSGVTHGRGVR